MDPKFYAKGEVKRMACNAIERVNLIAHGFEEVVEEAIEKFTDGGYIEASGDLNEPEPQPCPAELVTPKRGPGRPRKNAE